MLPILLPIIVHLLLSPCLAAEGVAEAELPSEPLATETAAPESQDSSTRRKSFDKAMKNHKEEVTADRNRGTVLRAVSKRWPNGEVPYILEDAFDENFRAIIAAAMADVHERTCIRWREKTEDDED